MSASELVCTGRGCLVLGLLTFISLSSPAADVTLAWNANPDPAAAGYFVYYGASSRSYTNAVDAGNNLSVTISNLLPGTTYYFAATTYSMAGLESDYSSEVFYTVPGSQTPTLDAIADLALEVNSGPQTVLLTGISAGAGRDVVIRALSSDPGVVPDPTVNYTSANPTGTLSIAPVPNAIGSAFITVVVDNGRAVSNSLIVTFTVSVTPGAGRWVWDGAYGWLWSAGNGWYGNTTFGWLVFYGKVASDHWAWSSKLQNWVGRMGGSSTLWSEQYRWLTVSGKEDGMAHASTLGWVWIGDGGFAYSAAFGWIWPMGDGTWFWTSGQGWLGVTPQGGIWCVSGNRWL